MMFVSQVLSFCVISRLLHSTLGPPEESEQRQAMVTTLVKNLLNAEVDADTGPCGGYWNLLHVITSY